jgi:hypothetical protein
MRLLANVLDAATVNKVMTGVAGVGSIQESRDRIDLSTFDLTFQKNTWNVHDEGGDYGIEDDRHTQMHESFKKQEKTEVD